MITQLNKKAIAVTGLPEGMTLLDAEIVTNQSVIPYGKQLRVPDGEYKCFPNHAYIDLPEGNWRILGFAQDLTEGDWKKVLDKPLERNIPDGIQYGYMISPMDTEIYNNATTCGHVLLKVEGVELLNTLILINQ